jgi:hypothetical protein
LSSIWLDRERHAARSYDTYDVSQTEIHGWLRIPVRRNFLFLEFRFRASAAGANDALGALAAAEASAAAKKEATNRAAKDACRFLEIEYR